MLLLGVMWLTTRPFIGILWDSEFYAVQALHTLWPARYADDLYFAFGSQDEFSIFSRIYAPVIAMMGLARANLLLTVLAQLCWLMGLTYLARGVFHGRAIYLALVGVIIFPGAGGVVFHYGEQILTPRILAEALTLWAIGTMWRGQVWRSAGILALALGVHPLMAISGCALWFLWFFGQSRRGWSLVGLLGVLLMVLAGRGVEPFVRLFRTFDASWWTIVLQRSSYCFISQWGIGEWFVAVHSILVLLWVFPGAGKKARRLLLLSFMVGLGGVVASWLGGDELHNVLILDAQLWRGLWLMNLIAHLFVVRRLQQLPSAPEFPNARSLWWASWFLTLLTGFSGGFYLVATPMLILSMVVQWWEEGGQKSLEGWMRAIVVVCLAGVLMVTLSFLSDAVFEQRRALNVVGNSWLGLPILLAALVGFRMSPALFPCASWSSAVTSWARLGVSMLLMFGAMLIWDQRTAWSRYVESTEVPPPELTALLPSDRPLYWEGNLAVPWLLLRRSSYFSCRQGTGALFSRGTAINYQKRYLSFQSLDTAEFLPGSYCASPALGAPPRIEMAQTLKVCEDNPMLGALVLLNPVVGMKEKVWKSPIQFPYLKKTENGKDWVTTDLFYIYDCPVQQ
ncbi:MAG: hypothetical protein G3I09_02750 [Ferrovum sp.]|nr:hypothetical protein [Ferrovum sp.]